MLHPVHVLHILKIYFQIVGIDFPSDYLIKLKSFGTGDSTQAIIRRFVLRV